MLLEAGLIIATSAVTSLAGAASSTIAKKHYYKKAAKKAEGLSPEQMRDDDVLNKLEKKANLKAKVVSSIFTSVVAVGTGFGAAMIIDEINTVDITPDSKYIALACASGNVLIYSMEGKLIKTFEFHTKNCECLVFNPRYMIMATADSNLVFWIPSDEQK